MIEKACVQIGAIDPSCDEYNSGSVIGVNADQAVVTDQIVSGRPGQYCRLANALGQMRAAIATKASGLFFATLRTASKPSSAQTSAKSRIKP